MMATAILIASSLLDDHPLDEVNRVGVKILGVCPPDRLRTTQVDDLVIGKQVDNPAYRNINAHVLIYRWMRDKYPCR